MKMTKWYSADELRQSWCLLTLNTDQTDSETYIRACEIGDGNAHQLIETESFSTSDSNRESELLHAIGAKLDERRYDGVSLVTPTHETLSTLRTRFVECDDIQQPTLRGFNHVSVSKLLEAYFNKNCTGQGPSLFDQCLYDESTAGKEWLSKTEEIPVTALWEALTTIGPLVPPEALQGKPL
jgi:hypothetical protein